MTPTLIPTPAQTRSIRQVLPMRALLCAAAALLAGGFTAPARAVVCDPLEITLTSPLHGAQSVAPASFTLTAQTLAGLNAEEPNRPNACLAGNVSFYANGVLLFSDTAAPWTYQWNAVPVGVYVLTAVATGTNIPPSTSDSVTVSVTTGAPNVPPTVTLTAPVNGATANAPASFVLAATASDSDGVIDRVQFFRNGVQIGTDTSLPYGMTDSNLAAGSYSYTARATDNLGALSAFSNAVNVIVNPAGTNQAPQVALTSPTNGATATAPATFTVAANASDADNGVLKVEFFRNGVLARTLVAPPYSYTESNLAAGSYSYTARATDTASPPASTTSSAVTITVNPDTSNQPPVVSLISPVNGSTATAPATFTVAASASDADNGIAKVEFFRNGVLARTFTAPPYSYTDTNLAAGSYSYTARATDNANPPASTTSSAVTVNVNPASGNQPPVVSLVSPANGSSATAPATFIVAANASDADQGIAKVEFFRNGVLARTLTVPPYSYTESNLAAGSYSYSARATDKAIPAASTSSASATITISPAAPTSLTRSYVYDSAQRLCKRIEPESGATVFEYDAAGNLAWSADGQNLPSTSSCDRASVPASARIVTSYDARNRPTLTDYPGTTPDISRTYFTDGAPRTIASAGNTWTNGYNKRRLMTSEVLTLDGVNYGISHGYNGNGHPASIGYPDGATLNYFPNGLGQPTVVGGYASNIRYYPNGAIQSFVYGNGITHTMTQNARRLPAQSRDAGPGGVVLDDSYAFDANGNVQSITDQASAGRTTRTMSYDNRDRLTAASAPGLWGNALFSYDALDNLKSADQGARQYRYVYDANQRLARITDPFGTTQWSFGYNPAGDQTSKNAQNYSFDAAHRLTAVAGIASYVYDGFGRRVKEVKANGSQDIGVYSQSGQRLYSKRGAESTRHVYLGNTLLAQTKTVGGIPQPDTYLHTDALGSVVAESTASGSIAKRNDYAPWGEPISGPLDGLGYTGHEMDPDTGLVYAQQRYYDPIVGRFLSVDPVAADANTGGNFNRYWYANNNPYRFTDPDGRVVPLLVVAAGLLTLSAPANAPGPNDTVEVMSGAEALQEVADKLPVGRVGGAIKRLGSNIISRNRNEKRSGSPKTAKNGEQVEEGKKGRCPTCGGKTVAGENKIADKFDMSPDDVGDSIHQAKESLPGATKTSNPDVEVCTSCGEMFPQTKDGLSPDSIGNINDKIERK